MEIKLPNKKTGIHKYLRMEFILTLILIGLAIITSVILSVVNTKNISFAIGIGLLAINFSLQRYDAVKRGIFITQSENAKALFEAVDVNFQMLACSWKDYNVSEATKYKSKWDAIISTAYIMKENGLISQQVYTLMLQSNIQYTDQETKIRLDNMREK